MKISQETIDILGNFSNINRSVLVKAGDMVGSISTSNDIIAGAKVEEDFDTEFAIYELPQFLNLISFFNNNDSGGVDINFGKEQSGGIVLNITDGDKKSSSKYLTSSVSFVKSPYEFIDKVKAAFTDTDHLVKFNIHTDIIAKLDKVSKLLTLRNLSIKTDGDDIVAVIYDSEDSSSNEYKLTIEENVVDGIEFDIKFKIDNFKFMDGEYTVKLYRKGDKMFSRFDNVDIDNELFYYLSVDVGSSFTDTSAEEEND